MTDVLPLAYFNAVSPLAPATIEAIAPLFHRQILPKGAYFAEAGLVAESFALMTEGVVRGFYRTADGAEYNKHFFVGPTIIGAYSSLITGKPNLINQQALTECTLWVADYARFNDCCDRFPDLDRLARRNAERLFAEKEQREIELVLLDAGRRYEQFQREYGHLEQIIPQYHIASYLGVTPTQLSRIRRAMAGR